MSNCTSELKPCVLVSWWLNRLMGTGRKDMNITSLSLFTRLYWVLKAGSNMWTRVSLSHCTKKHLWLSEDCIIAFESSRYHGTFGSENGRVIGVSDCFEQAPFNSPTRESVLLKRLPSRIRKVCWSNSSTMDVWRQILIVSLGVFYKQ
jgi:hypothetical protein